MQVPGYVDIRTGALPGKRKLFKIGLTERRGSLIGKYDRNHFRTAGYTQTKGFA